MAGPTQPAASRAVTARLIFAGTGGGAHVDRAHECVVVQFTPEAVLLLDTAGGFEVVRQLKRAGIDLATIRSIFVSHRHSDHIGGLEPLLLHVGLRALPTAPAPPALDASAIGGQTADLAVYGHPEVVHAGQALLASMTSNAPNLFAIAGKQLCWEPLQPDRRVALSSGGHLTPFVVDHEPPGDTCLGCRVQFAQGGRDWSIVFSGDTRPTPHLERHARGADVLIHEAGGVDAHAERVHATGHSTAGEAARLATKVGAKRLFLIHLPREEIRRAVLDEARQFYGGPVAVPDDLDTLDLAELPT